MVDTNTTTKFRINFNLTFMRVPCTLLSLNAVDVSGQLHKDITHHIKKVPLTKEGLAAGDHELHEFGDHMEGDDLTSNKTVEEKKKEHEETNYCGSCYGALGDGECCNTCQEVRVAYADKGWSVTELSRFEQCEKEGITETILEEQLDNDEGCNMAGYLEVDKVSGKFSFLPSKNFQQAHKHSHDVAAFANGAFNVSHTIHHLSFGEVYPGMVNPLDNLTQIEPRHNVKESKAAKTQTFSSLSDMLMAIQELEDERYAGGGIFTYYTKIVPTAYHYLNGKETDTNQFSVTEKFQTTEGEDGHDQGIPGVIVHYDFSPIKVQVSEQRMSTAHFLTQLCAIIGGVFTVAGMIDKAVYAGVRAYERKMQIGKIS